MTTYNQTDLYSLIITTLCTEEHARSALERFSGDYDKAFTYITETMKKPPLHPQSSFITSDTTKTKIKMTGFIPVRMLERNVVMESLNKKFGQSTYEM